MRRTDEMTHLTVFDDCCPLQLRSGAVMIRSAERPLRPKPGGAVSRAESRGVLSLVVGLRWSVSGLSVSPSPSPLSFVLL